MKAIIGGTVVADAAEAEVIVIESNRYFPPSSLARDLLTDSPTPYTCPWKGVAQYHDLVLDEATLHDAAWSYPAPYTTSFDRVGQDYSGYVAFDTTRVTVA